MQHCNRFRIEASVGVQHLVTGMDYAQDGPDGADDQDNAEFAVLTSPAAGAQQASARGGRGRPVRGRPGRPPSTGRGGKAGGKSRAKSEDVGDAAADDAGNAPSLARNESAGIENVGSVNAIQCTLCGKWRRLPGYVDAAQLQQSAGKRWTCADNEWDGSHADCGADEENVNWNVGAGAGVAEDAMIGGTGTTVPPLPIAASTSGKAAGAASARDSGRGSGKGSKQSATASAVPSAGGTGAQATAAAAVGGKKKRVKKAEWVQCENPSCNKWRKLPPTVSLKSLPPGKWFCELNYWDAGKAYCDAPEDSWDTADVTIAGVGAAGGGASADGEGGGVGVDSLMSTLESGEASAFGFGSNNYANNDGGDGNSIDEETGGGDGAHGSGSAAAVGGGRGGKRSRGEDDGAATAAAAGGRKKRGRESDSGSGAGAAAAGGSAVGAGARGIVAAAGGIGGKDAGAKPINLFQVPKVPLSAAALSLASQDRKTILPPSYVSGHKDYHTALLLHPVEVWADAAGGAGVLEDAVRQAYQVAIAAGPSASFGANSQPKVSYSDLTAKSWGSQNRGGAGTGVSAAAALESQMRWSRSTMHAKPERDDDDSSNDRYGVKVSQPAARPSNIAVRGAGLRQAAAGAATTDGANQLQVQPSGLKAMLPIQPAAAPAASAATEAVSPLMQVALELYAQSSSSSAGVTSSSMSPTLEAPDAVHSIIGAAAGQRQAVTARQIIAQSMGGGPRAALHAACITHGVVVHKGVMVHPLDIIVESMAEGSRWSHAAVSLSDGVRDTLSKAIAVDNRRRKDESRAQRRAERAAERARLKAERLAEAADNGDAPSEQLDEDDNIDDDDDGDELPLEVFGHNRINEVGYLFRPPYDAFVTQALQERVITVAIMACVVAADALNALATMSDSVAARLHALPALAAFGARLKAQATTSAVSGVTASNLSALFTSASDFDGNESVTSTSKHARGIRISAGMGAIAMQVRLQGLARAGLIKTLGQRSGDGGYSLSERGCGALLAFIKQLDPTFVTYLGAASAAAAAGSHRSASAGTGAGQSVAPPPASGGLLGRAPPAVAAPLLPKPSFVSPPAAAAADSPTATSAALDPRLQLAIAVWHCDAAVVSHAVDAVVADAAAAGQGAAAGDVPPSAVELGSSNSNNSLSFMLPMKIGKPWRNEYPAAVAM